MDDESVNGDLLHLQQVSLMKPMILQFPLQVMAVQQVPGHSLAAPVDHNPLGEERVVGSTGDHVIEWRQLWQRVSCVVRRWRVAQSCSKSRPLTVSFLSHFKSFFGRGKKGGEGVVRGSIL